MNSFSLVVLLTLSLAFPLVAQEVPEVDGIRNWQVAASYVSVDAKQRDGKRVVDSYLASGDVRVKFPKGAVICDVLEYDRVDNSMTFSGNPTLRIGGDILRAGKIVYSITNKSWTTKSEGCVIRLKKDGPTKPLPVPAPRQVAGE